MKYLLLVLFCLSYLGISARRLRWLPVGRPAFALIGAAACVAVGVWAGPPLLGVQEALAAIELNTLCVLFGTMVLGASLDEAGFFGWATQALVARSTSRAVLLWAVTVGSGVLAAMLLNDAVCLLATPLVVQLAKSVRAPVRPFLFALAMGSNAGSAMTLAGNPQNMLVAKLSGLPYREYVLRAGGAAFVALLLTAAVLHVLFRRALTVDEPEVSSPQKPPIHRRLLWVSVGVLVGSVVANILGVSLALTSVTAASVVLLVSGERANALLARVDWNVLLFFAGLFVLVAALQRTGFPLAWVQTAEGSLGHGRLALVTVLALGSQVVSNVPLILLLEPWIRSFNDASSAWALTAFVSTLAGNLTLLGSVANIIVLERANERLGFFEYLRVGVPVTAVSMLAGLLLLR